MQTRGPASPDDLPEITTQDFRLVSGGPVTLRYHPAIDPLEAALFRVACAQQVEVVETALQARIRPWRVYPGRLRVFLYPTAAEVSRAYGGPVGGYADWHDWYIAVNLAADWGGTAPTRTGPHRGRLVERAGGKRPV